MRKGGEGTHGHVDHKEGLYFGKEHEDNHPNKGLPLHGKNQFPVSIPEMKPAVLLYIDAVVDLGQALMDAFSLALKLDPLYIRTRYTSDPIVIFRAFNYPPCSEGEDKCGIGKHTDFGLLTILKQESDGLEVLSPTTNEWVCAPAIPNTFVCNVGDMFDRMTGGRFKSRSHRVRNLKPHERLSFPCFFDFNWNAEIKPLPLDHLPPLSPEEGREAQERWDQTTFRGATGQWWQYLAKKVQKVFPSLSLPDFECNVSPSTRFALAVQLEK